MKALIRNKGETITEDMDIPCIDWSTGYPLTGAKWFGGPYKLVQNYVAPIEEGREETYEEIVVEPEPEEDEPVVEEDEDDNDYIVINGVRYTKDELRSMLE